MNRDVSGAAALAQQAVLRNPRYLPAWRVLVAAQVELESLGEARAAQQQMMKRQPAFNLKAFAGSSPMREELEARFTRALRARACRRSETGYQRAGSFFLRVMRLIPNST